MASRTRRALYILSGTTLSLAVCACGSILPFVVPASDTNTTDSIPPRDIPSFSSSWSDDPAKGGWSLLHTMRANSIIPDSTTWHGKTSARVEVRPGDDPLNSTGERAEVAVMKNRGNASYENASSGTVYYAVSYKLPTDWKTTATTSSGWSIVLQLHGPDSLGYSPAISLNADSAYSLTIHAGDLPSDSVSYYDLAFTDPSLNLGKWTDFIIGVVFSPTTNGSVTVWRRNEGQMDFTRVARTIGIPTLQYDSLRSPNVEDHYWKQGLFRNSSSSITNVLWMGPTARGGSFVAVERAAFGTTTGPKQKASED